MLGALAVMASLVALAQVASAEPLTQPNAFIPGRTDIYSSSGQRIGTVEPSPFLPGTSFVYDNSGRRVLEIQPNPFLPGTLNLYDLIGHDDPE